MTKGVLPVNDADLHAYVDGELDESRRVDIEAYLAGNPDAAEQVRQYQQLNQNLHRLFDPVLNEPVPAALVPVSTGSHAGYGWLPGMRAAALAGIVLVSGLGGWLLHSRTSATESSVALVNLVQPAAFAHAVYTTDDQFPVEIQAEQQDVLSNWLSERMHTSIRAPDLGALGFDLVGGRLLPSTNRMAAQFMYQDAGGERITLYVRRIAWENRQAAFQYHEAEGVGVFYWIDGPMGYALSGSLGKKRLIAIAEAAQDAFAGGV
ncbi:MAG: anti-sigma factor [Gammaproteobacteria bacterium]|nr:MAG: anti-sigma factor [Gammaproteobacteria bacterium]